MRNNSVFLTLLLLLLFILISCEGDPNDWNITQDSIRFDVIIEGAKTRASGTSWDAGDAIGVYMKKSGSALDSSAFHINAKHVNVNGSSLFAAENESETMYYPKDESKVDFIGYYPYKQDITDFTYQIDLSDQSDLSKIDFMYSGNATDLNRTIPEVPMVFSHQLCKLVLDIEQFSATETGDLTIIITNTATKATFDLRTGELSSASEFGNIQLTALKENNKAEAILLPGKDISDQEVWFIFGDDEDKVFKYSLAKNTPENRFNRSTRYQYNIKLFAEDFRTEPAGNINDWISAPVVDVTLEPTGETPPQIKGSKKSPFSVAEAIVNQGKQGVWVEAYIVGGFTGTKATSYTQNPNEARQSSLAIAAQPNETDITAIMPVELPAGKVREALNIYDNQSNIGKKIIIKGNLERYYSVPGLKSPKEYMFTE
ncbi:MAG: fimbrillin family protein [Fermentimonas sp.]|nr:fimbrillin family protein [Fermentimonas sp.]